MRSKSKARPGLRFTSIDGKDEKIHSPNVHAGGAADINYMGELFTKKGRTTSAAGQLVEYNLSLRTYERDRSIYATDLEKQKRRYARDIRQLHKDLSAKKEELGVAVYGDKQFLRNVLQDHKRLQLAFINSGADIVYENLLQENFNKRKRLDRIKYTKKKKMEIFRNTQIEAGELRNRLLYDVGTLLADKKAAAVGNVVARANLMKNAALAVKAMYVRILDVLKKDSQYFTVVLDALKQDCRAQGKCLMGATEMGQLAMEYLDDRRFEFNKLVQEMKVNMKERKGTLELVKREITYLNDSFPNLIGREEAANLDELYEDEDAESQHSIHWELEEVLEICKSLQKATLVSSFEEVMERLSKQREQTEKLSILLQMNKMRRDALTEDRKHALLILDTITNIGQEETAEYRERRNLLRAELDAEKAEQENLIKLIDEKGRQIIEMKTSLQQINQLLTNVAAAPPRVIDPDEVIQPFTDVESDLDTLLATSIQKTTMLMRYIGKSDVGPIVKANAKMVYHNLLVKTMQDIYKEELVTEGGLIDFEMDDPSVPSYAVIKFRSKQLVESQVSEFDVPVPAKK